jgi:hypothetical protein
MNYLKLDAAVASALEDFTDKANKTLVVSVRTTHPLSQSEQEELKDLGGQGVDSGVGIYSATVDRTTLADLSTKPWVRLVSLARPLKMS